MSVQWMYPNVNLNLTISAQLHTKTFVFTNRDAVENKDGTECVNWLLLLDTLNWKTLQKLYIVFIYSFIYFYPINLIIFTKMTGTWATKDWKSCGVLKNEVINVQEQTMPRPLTDSITCADLWGVWALCLPLLRVTQQLTSLLLSKSALKLNPRHPKSFLPRGSSVGYTWSSSFFLSGLILLSQ